MNTFNLKNNKGFSVAEIIIYVAIAGMVFATLISFIFTVMIQRNSIESENYLDLEANFVIMRLETVIQNAVLFNSPNVGSTDTVLSLEVDDSKKSPTDIYILNDRLVLDENGDIFNLTSDNLVVSDFSVSNLSGNNAPEIIKMSFKLTSSVGATSTNATDERVYTTSFTLRDYAN